MKKKKLLTTAAWLTTLAATSQVVYTDITDASVTLTAPGASEFVAIDFNNDATEEYNFRWDLFGNFWFLHITFADGNEINRKAGATQGETYVEPMNANDVIDASDNWGTSFPEPFLGDSYDDNFKGLGDRYIGVKFNLSGNTHYGWILVSLDQNNLFTVKSYAYQSNPGTAINAGDTGTAGINDEAANLISIYPNPTGNVLAFKYSNGLEVQSVTVNDLTGKQVAGVNVNNDALQQTIDVSNLQSGIYMLTIVDKDNKSVTRKFIKN